MEKWLEVDLDKLKFNAQSLQNYFRVPVMAVIKQDGYGLGALAVATFLEQQGIHYFAVTNVSEGVELRKGGVVSPILIFAPCLFDNNDFEQLWRYNLTPTVYSMENAEALNSYGIIAGRPVNVHIKVDSGMGRMGFTPDELMAAAGRLKALKGIRYEGVFTHYSNAFEAQMDYTKKQMTSFLSVVERLGQEGLNFQLKYSANSLAALKFPETHMDMVTIGSAFLGNSTVNPEVPLKKVYRCRARVLQVRKIKKGDFIGYSNTYTAPKDMTTAVIPVGYTDGFGLQKKIDSFRFTDFLREQLHLIKSFLRPASSVYFEGRPLKVLGKTSLQLTVVDTGGLPVKAGDIVDVDLNPLFANVRVARIYTGSTLGGTVSADYLEEAAATAQDEIACTREE
ncbi:MAG TPA: alanine racemase [Desulfobacteria bacterium]|nr:alanine racemase [Desulfobacteria bacterium]